MNLGRSISSISPHSQSKMKSRYLQLYLGLGLLACHFVGAQDEQVVAVNGGWSPWSTITTKCDAPCGGGKALHVRSCTNPIPEGSGKPCEGDTEEWIPCNTHPCAVSWSPWSNCSANCGWGNKTRFRVCGPKKTACTDNQYQLESEACSTWNRKTCPNPCNKAKCPDKSECLDTSDDIYPSYVCECVWGMVMDKDGKACIPPPPTTPTPRPIPTLPPAQKVAAVIITKSAGTVLLGFLAVTLTLFLLFKIFTADRVIQMNMEMALAAAHLCLLFAPQESLEGNVACQVVSILLHFFFTACFMFLLLEALHMYSMVAYVVKKDGMLTRAQNIIVGWGIPAFVTLISISFQLKYYGSKYHCWLRMDTSLVFSEFIPIIIMFVIAFTLIEAAGAAEYKTLPGLDKQQLLSARISQRGSLIILPLTFASWVTGVLSEYEQNLPLYGTFCLLNGILGGVIFFFHCTGNEKVRSLLASFYKKLCRRG